MVVDAGSPKRMVGIIWGPPERFGKDYNKWYISGIFPANWGGWTISHLHPPFRGTRNNH